jgi:hypothetical protein
MTAAEVAQALAAARALRPLTGIDSVQAVGGRQVRVFLSSTDTSGIHILADPGLAIVDTTAWAALAGGVSIPAVDSLPEIDFLLAPLGDPRDVLDRGVDLMVIRERSVLEYAAGRPEFQSFPLPWTRTYVLIQAPGSPVLQIAGTEPERTSLARDAVPVDARPAESPEWWSREACSGEAPPDSTRPLVAPRVAYLRGDEVARSLAERVVAVAGRGVRLRTLALDSDALGTALLAGSEQAYVLALPRQTLVHCAEDLPAGWPVQPLIDTRAHAIVRNGSPPLTVDWDGTVRLAEP